MLDGLIVGLDMITKFVGTKKYRKRVLKPKKGKGSYNRKKLS